MRRSEEGGGARVRQGQRKEVTARKPSRLGLGSTVPGRLPFLAVTRLGFGTPHPALAEALSGLSPLVVEDARWGEMPLRIAAHAGMYRGPDELVSSVRCIVLDGDRVLVCDTPNGPHVVPGGRREPGETLEQTARREVHEETGCRVGAMAPLGFFHFTQLADVPAGYPYPHPELVQVVFTAPLEGALSDGWVDAQGWEQGTSLVPVHEALKLPLGATDVALLRIAIAR